MVMATLEFVGTLKVQFAAPLTRLVVLPSTTAVLPTKPKACVDCAVCCSETSVVSCSLVLSCCSTPANCTSCWVNWLVSSGSSGFWFCSCVVSSVRKVWKLPASVAPVFEPRLGFDEDFGRSVVPETTDGAVAAFVVVMIEYSSHSDVDAAARSEHAAVAAPDRGRGNCVLVADDQPAGIAAIVVVLAGVLAR